MVVARSGNMRVRARACVSLCFLAALLLAQAGVTLGQEGGGGGQEAKQEEEFKEKLAENEEAQQQGEEAPNANLEAQIVEEAPAAKLEAGTGEGPSSQQRAPHAVATCHPRPLFLLHAPPAPALPVV